MHAKVNANGQMNGRKVGHVNHAILTQARKNGDMRWVRKALKYSYIFIFRNEKLCIKRQVHSLIKWNLLTTGGAIIIKCNTLVHFC